MFLDWVSHSFLLCTWPRSSTRLTPTPAWLLVYRSCLLQPRVEEHYLPLGIIGEGTYGIVYKTSKRGSTDGQLYALKGMKGSAPGTGLITMGDV